MQQELISFAKNDAWVSVSRDISVIEVPAGVSQILPKGTEVLVVQALGGDYTVRTRQHSLFRVEGVEGDAIGQPVRNAIPDTRTESYSDALVEEQLRRCFDPEIPINILDLGLVYEVVSEELSEGGVRIFVKMTLTAPGCGMGQVLVEDVKRKVGAIPDVKEVKVDLVFDPPWDASMMSEAARLTTGLM